jgi:hypothetical protein
MTETIVLSTFFLVAQYLISFCRLFELFFCRLIARVAVGVILHRYFPVGFLDFIS